MMVILRALAEPNRLHIVELLRDGPRTVGEIVNKLHLHQPQVSKHLTVLSKVGLVKMYPDAQQRIYKLRAQPFKELDTWLESYRNFWEESFDRLDDYLIKLQEDEIKKAIPQISNTVLSERLRDLEEHGLITKKSMSKCQHV